MGVQWKVVREEVDVVLQQQRQTLFHPARDPAVLATPEKPVMNEDGVSLAGNCGLYQGAAGGGAAHAPAHLSPPFHLQTVGTVVLEAPGLEQIVEGLEQDLAAATSRALQG